MLEPCTFWGLTAAGSGWTQVERKSQAILDKAMGHHGCDGQMPQQSRYTMWLLVGGTWEDERAHHAKQRVLAACATCLAS